jgi:hypothetical protein
MEHCQMKRATESKSEIRRSTDPAVDAWQLANATNVNDLDYSAAIEDFEKAVPTSLHGILLKRRLERSRISAILDGDRLSWVGRMSFGAFSKTIDKALTQLARKGGRSE